MPLLTVFFNSRRGGGALGRYLIFILYFSSPFKKSNIADLINIIKPNEKNAKTTLEKY